MRILGIDPGVATIGFGLIEADRARVRLMQYGVITTPAGLPLSVRLRQISEDMVELLEQFKPEEMAGLSCWRRNGPGCRPSSTHLCRSSRLWRVMAGRTKNRSCS